MQRRRDNWTVARQWAIGGAVTLASLSVCLYLLASYDVKTAEKQKKQPSPFGFSHVEFPYGLPVLVFRSRDTLSRAEWSVQPFREVYIYVSKAQ